MKDSYLEIIEEAKKKKTLEKFIDMMYKSNFRFVHMNFLKDSGYIKKLNIKKAHKNYQFLVRINDIDKAPIEHTYDLRFIIAIRFFDKRSDKVHFYHNGQYYQSLIIKWDVKQTQNMKKKKVPLKFPDGMSIQDRIDWRKTHNKFKANKEIEEAELNYYLKWKPHIKNLDKENLHLR